MTITTISSQVFNQNEDKAKRTAVEQQSIVDAIALPEATEIEFEPEKLKKPFFSS